MVRGGNIGQWASCTARPDFAAVWTAHRPRRRWRVFLCAQHRTRVPGARELTADDRVALLARRRRLAAARDGSGWVPPGPLTDSR
jgi:hypothetical protein